MPRYAIGIHDFAIGNRVHFVEPPPAGIALERANIYPFMKPRIDQPGARLHRVAHETVLAAFPRRRFFTLIIALDVLIEVAAAAAEQRGVAGRQNKIENIGFGVRPCRAAFQRADMSARSKQNYSNRYWCD